GHQGILDFVRSIRGTVIVGMYTIEVEENRYAFFSDVVVVATIVEAVLIVGVVILPVELHLRILTIHLIGNNGQVGAKLVVADNIHIVQRVLVFLILFAYAAHHVNVQINRGLLEGEQGIIGVISRTPKSFFFSTHGHEDDRAAGTLASLLRFGKCFGQFQDGGGAASVIIGAIVDGAIGTLAYVIVVRSNHHVFVFLVGSFQYAQYIRCVSGA